MKRFLTFANGNSRGGWNDFRGDFDTATEAREHIWKANKRGAWTWAHVYDTKERKKLHVRLEAPEKRAGAWTPLAPWNLMIARPCLGNRYAATIDKSRYGSGLKFYWTSVGGKSGLVDTLEEAKAAADAVLKKYKWVLE